MFAVTLSCYFYFLGTLFCLPYQVEISNNSCSFQRIFTLLFLLKFHPLEKEREGQFEVIVKRGNLFPDCRQRNGLLLLLLGPLETGFKKSGGIPHYSSTFRTHENNCWHLGVVCNFFGGNHPQLVKIYIPCEFIKSNSFAAFVSAIHICCWVIWLVQFLPIIIQCIHNVAHWRTVFRSVIYFVCYRRVFSGMKW